MRTAVSLVPIDRDGVPRGYDGVLPDVAAEVFRATVELYRTVGFDEPWIGYLALAGTTPVGTCGFKSPPRDGRVEIAYFTFPEFEGRGFAAAMAAELVALARRHQPALSVAAQTLPERNASHRVLEKLGFRRVATIEHPEDGTVWEWRLASSTDTAAREVRRPLLILDIDETLVWATPAEPDRPHDFRAFRYYVTKRPHLPEFLGSVFRWFDVAVWTSSGEDYANIVVEEVFPDVSELRFVWTASRCTQRYDPDTGQYYALKDLKKVKRMGFPLERILVIDDSPEKLSRQYGNHLWLPPFEGDPDDRELLAVLPFLDWIRTQDDFRAIDKRGQKIRRAP